MAADSSAWAATYSGALLGLPAAAAEQEVAGAGLRVRIAGPGTALTLDHRSGRITLETDASGIVVSVRAG